MSLSCRFLDFLSIPYTPLLFLVGSWCFSFFTCRALIRHPYILRDIPNKRSGHQRLVSRGGALAFALPILLFLFISLFLFSFQSHEALENFENFGKLDPKADRTAWAFAWGALFFALLGFLDDRYRLSAGLRFCLSLLFCSFLCVWVQKGAGLLLGGLSFTGGPAILIQILWLLICINFFNFMDGMDGLAALQAWWIAILVSIGVGLDLRYLLYLGSTSPLSLSLRLHSFVFWSYLGLACVLTAFLYWNWPRAKLFMGDGGSYFLGFVLGFSVLWAMDLAFMNRDAKAGYLSALDAGLICLAWMPFLLDAGLTLLERLKGKANIFQAHREHLYQKLLVKGWPPEKIIMLYASLNGSFLLPIILWFVLRSLWPVLLLSASITAVVSILILKLKKS